jgi:DNA-binding response OmpR family regulator
MELCGDQPLDVAIMSLYLPDGAGMTAVVESLIESPGVEIIGLAGRARVTDLPGFGGGGATKSLTKPVDRRELLKAIDEVLRQGPKRMSGPNL